MMTDYETMLMLRLVLAVSGDVMLGDVPRN